MFGYIVIPRILKILPPGIVGHLQTALPLVLGASTSGAAFGVLNPSWEGVSDLQDTADGVGTDDEILLNTTRYERVHGGSAGH